MDWRRYYDDPDTVLKEYKAEVVINDSMTSDGITFEPCVEDWYLTWKHGCIRLGPVGSLSEHLAKVQAALFCYLYKSGVSASESDDISCGYAACHQWFSGIQKVFQLQAIGHEIGGVLNPSFAIRSERLWYSREAAEKCKLDFLKTVHRKGMEIVEDIQILTLELRR
jgi:hypothetical protein